MPRLNNINFKFRCRNFQIINLNLPYYRVNYEQKLGYHRASTFWGLRERALECCPRLRD